MHLWPRHLHIAERAFYPQAASAHRREVGAARDEMDLDTGGRQAGAEVAADPARAEDREARG
jgi:hypothetical protein